MTVAPIMVNAMNRPQDCGENADVCFQRKDIGFKLEELVSDMDRLPPNSARSSLFSRICARCLAGTTHPVVDNSVCKELPINRARLKVRIPITASIYGSLLYNFKASFRPLTALNHAIDQLCLGDAQDTLLGVPGTKLLTLGNSIAGGVDLSRYW